MLCFLMLTLPSVTFPLNTEMRLKKKITFIAISITLEAGVKGHTKVNKIPGELFFSSPLADRRWPNLSQSLQFHSLAIKCLGMLGTF